jgi:hypothetical protein
MAATLAPMQARSQCDSASLATAPPPLRARTPRTAFCPPELPRRGYRMRRGSSSKSLTRMSSLPCEKRATCWSPRMKHSRQDWRRVRQFSRAGPVACAGCPPLALVRPASR